MNKTELWVDKKRFKYIIYPLMIAGAILGLVLGVFIGESVGERLAFALIGAIVGGLFIPIITLPVMFVEGLVVWIKARKAKSAAYYMIEYGRIYPEQFQKVISALERWNDREARHLLDDLDKLEYELEQLHDKKEEMDEDESDENEPFANVSTEDLLALKEKHKNNASIVSIIDGVLEARAKATEEF